MDLTALLYSLGLSGFFSSRAFLPAFATSLALKYGDRLPWLRELDFIETAANTPMWITQDWAVATLGVLAVLELFADKSPELRELMDEGMVYVKTALAAATSFGLLNSADVDAASDLITGIARADLADTAPPVLTAGLTYVLSRVRQGFVGALADTDEDDAVGLRSGLSWLEDLWALFGVWLLLLLPALVVSLVALVFAVLWLLQRHYEKKQEAARLPCPRCGTRIHPFATACYTCGAEVAAPRKLGFLGRTLPESQPDRSAQRVRLLELKRSPLSGERAQGRGVGLVCATDQVKLFGDAELTRRYIETIDARLLKVALVCGLLSLVPLVGLIAGVVYYRLHLVSPYRRYLRLGRSLATRWLIRLLFLLLIFVHFIPLVGALAVPAMACISHRFYRSAFINSLKKEGLALG